MPLMLDAQRQEVRRIDAELALIAVIVVPVLFVLSRVYTRRVRRRYHDLKELEKTLELLNELGYTS